MDKNIPDFDVQPDHSAVCERQRGQYVIGQFESRIRRRVRGKLIAAGLMDGQLIDDVMQSVRRRTDEAIASRKIAVDLDGPLIAYVQQVAENVVREAVRREIRAHRPPSECAIDVGERESYSAGVTPRLDDFKLRLTPRERELLWYIARDVPFDVIARSLQSSVTAVRKQWWRLRERLRNISRRNE